LEIENLEKDKSKLEEKLSIKQSYRGIRYDYDNSFIQQDDLLPIEIQNQY
jgi:hypothetical protein